MPNNKKRELSFGDIAFEEGIVPEKPTVQLPRWAMEEYPESALDMAEDLYRAIYWNIREKAEETAKTNKKPITPEKNLHIQTLLAMKSLNASAIQSSNVAAAWERAFLVLANRVGETESYRVNKEYDTIEEWAMSEILELQEGSPKVSHFSFLINEFLPMIKTLSSETDMDPTDLLVLREHQTKTWASIPYLRAHTKEYKHMEINFEESKKDIIGKIQKLEFKRDIVSEEDLPEVEEQIEVYKASLKQLNEEHEQEKEKGQSKLKKAINKTIEVIKDPKIMSYGPNGVSKTLKNNGNRVTFEGDKALLPDKRVAYVVIVTEEFSLAVESGLREFVEFNTTDGATTVAALGKAVLKDGSKPKPINKKGKQHANLQQRNSASA